MDRSELEQKTIYQLYQIIWDQEDMIKKLLVKRRKQELLLSEDSIAIVFKEEKNPLSVRFIKEMRRMGILTMLDLKKEVDEGGWEKKDWYYGSTVSCPIECCRNIGKKTVRWAKMKYENYYKNNHSIIE